MSAGDPPRIAAELLVAHRPAMAGAAGAIDECIRFTRMAVDVCRERGVRARPLPVSVEITATAAPGAPVLLGFEGLRPPDAPDDYWDGHLVAILDSRLLVDLSIDSIARPEIGLEPEPFVAEVRPEFLAGGSLDLPVSGGQARYRAQPERSDYRDLPAWTQGTPEENARLADALLWPASPSP